MAYRLFGAADADASQTFNFEINKYLKEQKKLFKRI